MGELMKHALASTSVAQVQDAVARVESAQGIEWGDLLPKKKQLLKKLRAKRKKMQSGDGSPVPEESPPAAGIGAAQASGGSNPSSQSASEKEWVVLKEDNMRPQTQGKDLAQARASGETNASGGPVDAPSQSGNSAVLSWCEELKLPIELAERMAKEDILDPEELTGLGDPELLSLASGFKMGPK